MIYGVNNIELGINDILQLLELTLGEGKLYLFYTFFIYFHMNNMSISISGHFGDEYPWHTKTVEELTARLVILSRSLEKKAKISLRIGLDIKN